MKPMNVTWVWSFGIIWSLIQLKIEDCAFIALQNGLKHELLIETEQRATAVVKFTLQKLFVKTPEFRDQSTGINIFAMVVKVVQVFIQTGAVHYPTRRACCGTMVGFAPMVLGPRHRVLGFTRDNACPS